MNCLCDECDEMEKLKAGNKNYAEGRAHSGDISPERRRFTAENGQKPYAVVVTCSDSRVIPEHIFNAGIGELFVIRVAGNVIGEMELGSIEYAAGHCGAKLILVLGHDNCGAVDAAIHSQPGPHIKRITDEIRLAIGSETNPYKASCMNVLHSVEKIKSTLLLEDESLKHSLRICGALYHIASGLVEFLD